VHLCMVCWGHLGQAAAPSVVPPNQHDVALMHTMCAQVCAEARRAIASALPPELVGDDSSS
jgi:hypothetical protein